MSLLCCQISTLPHFLIAFLLCKACWENRAHEAENVVLNESFYDWKSGETRTFPNLVMSSRFLWYSRLGFSGIGVGIGVGISLFNYNDLTFMFECKHPTPLWQSFIMDQKLIFCLRRIIKLIRKLFWEKATYTQSRVRLCKHLHLTKTEKRHGILRPECFLSGHWSLIPTDTTEINFSIKCHT